MRRKSSASWRRMQQSFERRAAHPLVPHPLMAFDLERMFQIHEPDFHSGFEPGTPNPKNESRGSTEGKPRSQ